MLPTQGSSWKLIGGINNAVFTIENARVYGSFLGERYRDKFIIWILGSVYFIESEEEQTIVEAMSLGMKASDGGAHLINFYRHGPERSVDARFRAEFGNIGLDCNLYQTTLEEGVQRVVVASSNHAANYYESLILDGTMDFVDPDQRALSKNYYGWAKEVYEHLGFIFAVAKMTKDPIENIQLRIGGPRETDITHCDLGDLRCMRRALAVYISDRDMQQLFVKALRQMISSTSTVYPSRSFTESVAIITLIGASPTPAK